LNYSFAVPSNCKKVIDDLLEFGSVQEAVVVFVFHVDSDKVKGKILAVEENELRLKPDLKKTILCK
jgi:hypothetical protein